MQTIFWALGSMLVLMLIIVFLPIGITLRGKILVVLTGFVLALGGLAAVTSFPLWQSALMLFLLVMIIAYIMDSRLGAFIYNQDLDLSEEESDESPVINDFVNQQAKSTDLDMLDLGEIEITQPSTKNIESVNDLSNELQPQMVNENDESTIELQPQIANENDELTELVDEEMLFLDDSSETEEVENTTEFKIEVGYLADIESLLFEEPVELNVPDEDDLLEEITEIKEVKLQDEKVAYDDEIDLEELFFALEETAASNEDTNEKSNLKKPVQLQK